MKEGDIVVCINSNGKKQLTIGKQYIINLIGICDVDDDIFEMGIIDDDDRQQHLNYIIDYYNLYFSFLFSNFAERKT